MRSLYRNIIFLIPGLIILIAACEKDEIEPLFDKGAIRGITYYYDETVFHGDPIPLDNVTVTAIGPYGSKSDITDANGEYEISNLGNGTYIVECTKQGWGAAKHYSLQIYGNDVLYCNKRMYKRPDFDMPALYQSDGSLDFRSNLSSAISNIPYLRAFLSKTKDVSCVKYDYSSGSSGYVIDGYINYSFDKWHFPEEHGYVIIYVASYEDQGYYTYDYNLGLETFPSIDTRKHSQVFKF